MEQQTTNIFPHPDFGDKAKLFYQKYELRDIVTVSDPIFAKRSLKKYSARKCRFCGLSYPEVAFSNYSHLVPQLIGNSDLYSDFECDSCNEKISVWENDFANFLGISRSIVAMQKDKKAPGFVARRLTAKSRSFIGDNILIIAPEDYAREGGRATLSYIKNSFIPSNVYKSLLKSAISLLPEQEATDYYTMTLQYLKGAININNGAIIFGYKLSFQTIFPLHVFLFRKRRKEDNIPTDIVSFHFQNHIISLPIPFHRDDIVFYNNDIETPVPPPYFVNQNDLQKTMPSPYIRDLAAGEIITDEEENITLIIDPTQASQTVSYSPHTGVVSESAYALDGIKYLIMTKNGVTFDPKTFSAFMKKYDNIE